MGLTGALAVHTDKPSEVHADILGRFVLTSSLFRATARRCFMLFLAYRIVMSAVLRPLMVPAQTGHDVDFPL
jgi:hypothetical protein